MQEVIRNDDLVAQICGLHVNHAAPADSGGGGVLQVFDFENGAHLSGGLDDLARSETQLAVVVQHCIQVLDPDGVHRAVEHYPLPALNVAIRRLITHYFRQDSLDPVLSLHLEHSVQLVDSHAFWVYQAHYHFLAFVRSRQFAHRFLQAVYYCGLTG